LQTLKGFPGLVQASLLSDETGQRLEQFDGPSEQLSTHRQRLRNRFVDVEQQLAGSIEQRFAGDCQLDSVR
jgi:5'(3')-deoxyribonucleotidase